MPIAADPPAPHTALYRRWRAQTFAEIVGQGPVVETLRNSIRLGRLGHAYLFVGPRGTGKTSMARILAKAANCTDLRDGEPCDRCAACVAIREGAALDVAEFDAASSNTVADMRDLLPRVYTAPSDLRTKVFIVDEVQRIKEGWDVLLKTLEEPPDHVLFIFCTTDPSQIRPAVVSRVQRFTFRPLSRPLIAGKLERILAAEGRAAEPEAVALIASLAAGGMRDAESMLDQLLSGGPVMLTADDVRAQLGMAGEARVDAFLGALLSGDLLTGIHVLDALEAEGRDLRLFTEQTVDRLRAALVARLGGEHVGDPLAATHDLAAIAGAARRLSNLDFQRGTPGGQRFRLEMALLAERPGAEGKAVSPTAGAASVGQHRATADLAAPGALPPRPAAPARSLRGPPVASAMAERPETSEGRTVDPAEPVEAADRPGPGDLLDRLVARWPDVVEWVSRNPAVKPLVAACRPVRIEGNVVVLGFPENQGWLREKAEQRQGVIEQGIAAVIGMSLPVRCVATNLEASSASSPEVLGLDNLELVRRVFADDLVEAADIE